MATTSTADDAAPLTVAPRLDVVVIEQLQRIEQTVARVEETQAQIRQELAAGNAGAPVHRTATTGPPLVPWVHNVDERASCETPHARVRKHRQTATRTRLYAGTDVIPRMEATFARLTARARKCKDLLKACDALEHRCARLDASLRALEEQRAAKSPRP